MGFHHRTILRLLSVSNGRKLPRCSLIILPDHHIWWSMLFICSWHSPSSKGFDHPNPSNIGNKNPSTIQHLGLDGARIPTDFATVPPSHHVKRLPSGTRRFSSMRGWPFWRCLRMWSASVLWWAPWGSLGSGRLGSSEKENVDGVDWRWLYNHLNEKSHPPSKMGNKLYAWGSTNKITWVTRWNDLFDVNWCVVLFQSVNLRPSRNRCISLTRCLTSKSSTTSSATGRKFQSVLSYYFLYSAKWLKWLIRIVERLFLKEESNNGGGDVD